MSVVTVKLSIKRFREERWWDRTAESYTNMLIALHKMKRYLEESVNDFSWEHLDSRILLIDECLTEIRKLAKVDLKVMSQI